MQNASGNSADDWRSAELAQIILQLVLLIVGFAQDAGAAIFTTRCRVIAAAPTAFDEPVGPAPPLCGDGADGLKSDLPVGHG